ncbi:MAG: ABC transporter substrate-binding protein [Planctomycetota bacterium]
MPRLDFVLAVMLPGVLMVSLAGCERPGPDADATTNVTTAPETATVPDRETLGGVMPAGRDTLLLAYSSDPSTLNGITASDTVSAAFHRQVYEGLAQADYSNPDNLLPALAESWEFDEETLTFTIHLRRGVKWHPMQLPDGTPLPDREFTSRDVKFTFDCVLNPHIDAAHIRSYFENPEPEDETDQYKIRVKVVDDYTVKIRWTEPYFLAEQFTLGAIPMIPRHVYSVDERGEPISFDFTSKEFADGFNSHWANGMMCGTGPMMFRQWTRNQRLVLDRFNDYWGEPFYFSQIRMRCIPNANTMVQMGLQRELDWVSFPEKDQWLQSETNASVKAGEVKLVDFDYPGYRYVGYNQNRPVFSDRDFRLALAHATPVEEIIDEVFHGLAIRVSGPFLPGSAAADDSIEPIPFDLEKARSLLEEAGWRDTDDDGVRDKRIDGARVPAAFDLMIFADSRTFRTIAEIIQEEFRKIGVRMQITPAEWALFLERLNSKEFDAAMLGWATGWTKTDPYQLWHGSLADAQASSNHVGYRNPEVDALIEQLRVTMDEAEQEKLYHRIHRLIFEDQPYTFLFSEKATAGYDTRIENVEFYRLRPCIDTREWYSSQPRVLER